MTAIPQPQPGPQTWFLDNPASICIYGGAAGGGKTFALLLDAIRHREVPGFGAVIFRRVHKQVVSQGGLWDAAGKMLPLLGAVPNRSEMCWRFPSGARLTFAHLAHEDTVYDWQGSELPLCAFDELTHFTEAQFWYMLSRNRTTCGVVPYIRATCNPDADSWVATFLSWWIDQTTGQAIPERSGKVRWMVRIDDRIQWGDSREEMEARYPTIPPKSVSFVPARLEDNRILEKADPGYRATLLALPLVERERLLGANWKVRPSAGLVFNRAWFTMADAAPALGITLRYWDKASVPGGGDYSAGVKMRKGVDGRYYVLDVLRGQWSALERNRIIRTTAELDGKNVRVVVEQEGGSGGKESAELTVRELAGWHITLDRPTGDKVTRAGPLSAQAEAGNIILVRNPSRDWISQFLDELHGFPEAKNDDVVDAASGAFKTLALLSTSGWKPSDPEAGRSEYDRLPEDIWGQK